jgi:hypothetical protein
VSYDGTLTWKYVMDIDDWDGDPRRYMNHGLRVIDGKLWIFIPRRIPGGINNEHRLIMWRIDPQRAIPSYHFPGTH